jgi:hypothetical protein
MYDIVAPDERWPVALWLLSRMDRAGRPATIRLVVLRRDTFSLVASIDNPYTGYFSALVDEGFDLVITGPRQGMPPREPIVVTQLLRAHLACGHASR